MHKPVVAEQVLEVAGAALAHGSATRTELLTAAVTARASTPVIEVLLGLPELGHDGEAQGEGEHTGERLGAGRPRPSGSQQPGPRTAWRVLHFETKFGS